MPHTATSSDVDVVDLQQETTHSVLQPTTVERSSPEKKFPVIEVFGPVFQGEGSQAGQQTLFIRFGGCDYRCQKCDSMHAVDPKAIRKHAQYMSAEGIATAVMACKGTSGVKWITFSGGNPAMHKLDLLVQLLRDLGFYINVETQGSLWQNWFYLCDNITISPKGPGMGEKFELEPFLDILNQLLWAEKQICLKVVVFSQMDLEFAIELEKLVQKVTQGIKYSFRTIKIDKYLSLGNPWPPTLTKDFELVDNMDEGRPTDIPLALMDQYRSLAEDILPDSRLKNWRFLPQIHVLAYSNETRR